MSDACTIRSGHGGWPVGEVGARLAVPTDVVRADLRASDPPNSPFDGGPGIALSDPRAQEHDNRFRQQTRPTGACTCDPELAQQDIRHIGCPQHGLAAFLQQTLDSRVVA